METEERPTTTPPSGPPRGRRLTKSRSDRVIAGVSGGLGEYFGVDAVLFRIGFIALTVAGGSGLALYGLAWLLLPEVEDGENTGERIRRWFHHKPVLFTIGAIIVFCIFSSFDGGRWGRDNDGLWGIVLIGLGIAFLVSRNRRSEEPPAAPLPSQDTPPDTTTVVDEDIDPLLVEAAKLDPMAGATPTATMWPPSPALTTPVRVRPRPFLTPVTISLLLLGAGVAGLVGMSLQTFLALALLGVGAVMLLGSRWGRARGLLAVGLLLTAAATATSVTDVSFAGGMGDRTYHPTAVAQIRPYRLGLGELTIDLSDIELTGTETVKARVGVGSLTVLVPSDIRVVADTHVGLGQVTAFGRSQDGSDVDEVFQRPADREAARELRLDLDAGIGEINVEVR
jgi:phage shock protein PspC (stress-responsive transcriptional regulator)